MPGKSSSSSLKTKMMMDDPFAQLKKNPLSLPHPSTKDPENKYEQKPNNGGRDVV